MDTNEQKEQFSNAFIVAVTAAAGFVTGTWHVDDDCIDWEIRDSAGDGVCYSPRLELQLKCTASVNVIDGHIRFRLPIRTYNGLTPLNAGVARILVLVVVPLDAADWVTLDHESLVLRHCAYWVSLRGWGLNENQSSVTVRVPVTQRFDVSTLRAMMERIRAGGYP